MNGLKIMQAIVAGELPHPSIADTMPMTCTLADRGRVVFEVMADQRHLNPLGGVHGGFAATVMDSVTGCAIHTMIDEGMGYGTIDLHVRMLRPVPRNIQLLAEGTVLNMSRSLGVSEGTLKDSDGKLYAHATASCMLFPI